MVEFHPIMQRCTSERKPILEGPYDLVVIGGGINGTAIARDAALRGKTVVLLEKGDFGEGTSSRSSKMIHGGLRYLERLQVGLVYESLRERACLLEMAPHLVQPQRFLLPIYEGGPRPPWMIRLGLRIYDLLSIGRRLGRSGFLDRAKTLESLPGIRPDGLLGCGIYYDALMDDARLVLLNVLAALEERGGDSTVVFRNYARAVSVKPGSPSAVEIVDGVSGRESRLFAHRVVKAIGPWTDPGLLLPSRGAHVVLPALPIADGLLLLHSKDDRVFFCLPWLGRTVVGTTEAPFSGSPEGLRARPDEIDYLLGELERLFPQLSVGRGRLLGTFVGIRPLARPRRAKAGDPATASRRHRIREDSNGILCVLGGKYTTYRRIARDVVDRLFPGTRSTTGTRPLPGGEAGPWERARRTFEKEIARHGEAEVARLFGRYGTRLRRVLSLLEAEPALGEPLAPPNAETRAEAVYAVQEELAVYPADFLARRTTLRWTADNGRSAYDAVETVIRERAPAVPPDLERARLAYLSEVDWEETLRTS